jgi:glyoxylase-like metal-dependent hydrolase (beta-lactamase superfamily II)
MNDVITIDGQYLGYEEIAACYLITADDELALVDNNAQSALSQITSTIDEQIKDGKSLKYLILTHIHLDHAGLTGKLAKLYPEAMVVVHPKGVRHMHNPSRLEASSRSVYGDDAFDEMYGQLIGVVESQLISPADGEKLPLGNQSLKFIYTKGHANHHFCIVAPFINSIFTGDSFGLAYPHLNEIKNTWIYPSTSPTDFDYEEALISLDKIQKTGMSNAYLTHFGVWSKLSEGAEQLKEHLQFHEHLRQEMLEHPDLQKSLPFFKDKLQDYTFKAMKSRGLVCSQGQKEIIEYDIKLNIQGLAFVAAKSRNR